MPKQCPRCGYLNPDNAVFCAKCGYNLSSVTPQVIQSTTTQQQQQKTVARLASRQTGVAQPTKENFIIKILTYYFILLRNRHFFIISTTAIAALLTIAFQSEIINYLERAINNPYYDTGITFGVLGVELGILIADAVIGFFVFPEMTRFLKSELKKLHGDPYVRLAKLLIGKERFVKLIKFVQKSTRSSVMLTGEYDRSIFIIAKYEALAIDLIPIVVLLLIIINVGLVFLGNIVTIPLAIKIIINLAIAFIPLYEFLYPISYYSSKASEMMNYFPYELPFFAVLASIAVASGLPLSYVYTKLSKSDIMKGFKREAKAVERDLKSLGRSLYEILTRRARIHKSRDYSLFLYGYTAIVSSGGDVELYLTDKARQFIQALNDKWRIYADRVTAMSESVILLFLLIPMLVAIVSVIGGGPAFLTFLIFFPPLFGVVLYNAIKSAKPKTLNEIKYKPEYGLLAGLFTFAISFPLQKVLEVRGINVQPYEVFFIAGLVGLTVVYVQVRDKVKEIKEVEESLPEFLRQITEFRKIGYDLNKGIFRAYETLRFSPYFEKLLRSVVSQMKSGIPLNQVKVRSRSWVLRLAFYILGLLTEGGNVPPAVLENLTTFLGDYVYVKREAYEKTRVYIYMGLLIPVLIAGAILFVIVIFQSFPLSLPQVPGSSSSLPLFSVKITPQILDLVYIFLEETAIAVGLVMNKIIGETVMDTPLPIIGLILTMIVIQVTTYLAPILTSTLV